MLIGYNVIIIIINAYIKMAYFKPVILKGPIKKSELIQ